MRPALTIKNSNRQVNTENQNKSIQDLKNGRAAKMTRQVGRSNLRESPKSPILKLNYEVKEDFVVYEDPWPTTESSTEEINENGSSDNNMIHVLEKKMNEQKKSDVDEDNRKKFMQTRETSVDMLSVWDEASSAAPSVALDDDDFDRQSAASTVSIRADLTEFHVGNKQQAEAAATVEPLAKLVVDENREVFADSDINSKYVKSLVKKEQRVEEMLSCEEYSADIYRYMLDRQTKIRASSRYITKQAEVSVDMRSILIDWFNDVVSEYGLQQETLHLAVALVDRVLSKFCVEKHRLQLVGTTALMIASKYEEIYPPQLNDFAHITDDTFRVDQILLMERYLLVQLDFVVSTPTSSWFGALFARHQAAKKQTCHLMEYLIDLSLLDYTFLRFRPSHIAAACLCFANVLTDEEPWPEKMVKMTEIRISGFAVVLPFLRKMFRDAPISEYPSIYTKYSDASKGGVALLPVPFSKYVIDSEVLKKNCPELYAEAAQFLH